MHSNMGLINQNVLINLYIGGKKMHIREKWSEDNVRLGKTRHGDAYIVKMCIAMV